MGFKLFQPHHLLQPYIQQFAISEATDEGTYKVLPDTVLVMGFQYRGKLFELKNNTPNALSTFGVTGISDAYKLFHNAAETGSVLVYFKEGGASAFFKEPLHELFKESLSLDNFMLRSELLLLEEQLQEAPTDFKKNKVIEDFLLSKIKPSIPDQMVLSALALIHESKGNVRMKDLAVQLQISQSALEKRFRKTIGASPKKFASIIRLKYAVSAYRKDQSYTQLGYEAGFYDQAHFIKEFKHFTGETPDAFFSKE